MGTSRQVKSEAQSGTHKTPYTKEKMLKIAICLFLVAGGVSSAPVSSSTTERPTVVPLLRFESNKHPDGSFNFNYEGGDQSYRQETGTLTNAGTEDEALEVTGSYRYIDAEGNTVEVTYTAGKNGFVPIGTIIPSEISELAKAAADLPSYSAEEEQEQKLSQRRARAQEDKEVAPKAVEAVKVEEPKAEEPKVKAVVEQKAAESQVVPVKVVLEETKKPSEAESKKVAQV